MSTTESEYSSDELYCSDESVNINNSKWEIFFSRSLLECTVSQNPDSETAQKYQQAFDEYEKEKFIEWKHATCKILTKHIDDDVFAVIANYCEQSVAHYYSINTTEEYFSGQWIKDPLRSKIPDFLQGKVRFGDIIHIPGHRGDGTYIVNDIDNNLLIQVGHDQEYGSFDGAVGIPIEITDELCDPIEFYRFYSPTQGLQYQDFMLFSFKHSYIQTVLGLHAPNYKNVSFNNLLYSKWKYYIAEQKWHRFPEKELKIYPRNHEAKTLFIGTDVGEICVPIMYAINKDKPLICYVEQLYNKRLQANKLKQQLKIKNERLTENNVNTLPIQVQQNLCIISAMIGKDDDNRYGCNRFEINLNKPVSWSMCYLSMGYGEFVGMKSELKEMIDFIKSTNYIHLCYVIDTTNSYFDGGASFSDLNGLITPHFERTLMGCSTVLPRDMYVAAAILRGIQLNGYPNLRWKTLGHTVMLQEYRRFIKRDSLMETNQNFNGYLVNSDDQCVDLVSYLLKYYSITRKVKKYILSAKAHQTLMLNVKKILND
eukprot:205832_1